MKFFKPFVLACVIPLAISAAEPPVVHVRNFGEVNGHLLRGAEPNAAGMQELAAAGVKLVVDLREAGRATDREKAWAGQFGMHYVNIPLAPVSAPTQAQINRLVKLLTDNESETIFVHCRRGKDRTGTVIACYRIQHEGWPNDRALAEAKGYGMSAAERGMRSFIVHFIPMNAPTLLKTAR